MEKVLGGIVVYNPVLGTLNDTISSLLVNCSKVLLFRNSVLGKSLAQTLVEKYTDRLEFVGCGENVGLGEAHVFFLNYARQAEYDYLILSDQDSYYPENFTKGMLEFGNDNCCIVCPAWVDLNSGRHEYRMGQYFLEGANLKFKDGDNSGNLAHGITSGMFINMKILPEHIMPDMQLFIDWIDNDWCWRLISEGFVIGYNPEIILKHELGDDRSALFGFTRRSETRNYYILRNLVFLLINRSYKVRVKRFLIIKLCQQVLMVLFLSRGSFIKRFSLVSNALYRGYRGILGLRFMS